MFSELDFVFKVAGLVWTLVTCGFGLTIKLVYDRYMSVMDDLKQMNDDVVQLKVDMTEVKNDKVSKHELQQMVGDLERKITENLSQVSNRLTTEAREDRLELKADISKRMDMIVDVLQKSKE